MRNKGIVTEVTTETARTTTYHLTRSDILKLLKLPEQGSTVDFPPFDSGSENPVVVIVRRRTFRTTGGDNGNS